jgi:hypothetical protein
MNRKHSAPGASAQGLSMPAATCFRPASLANVGVTINARELEHAISKMLTNPLQEVRESGAQIRDAARESTPPS